MDIMQKRRNLWRMKTLEPDAEDEDDLELIGIHSLPRFDHMFLDSRNVLYYVPDDLYHMGLYVYQKALSSESNYFEIEILGSGAGSSVMIGLAPPNMSLDKFACCATYKADKGMISFSDSICHSDYKINAPRCDTGDIMGCGLRFESFENRDRHSVIAFFTKNGREVGSSEITSPSCGLHPVITMNSVGEEVKLNIELKWDNSEDEDTKMSIDGYQDDWLKLHYVRLNGSILEYTGKGKKILDVGLAQAKSPLDTTSHYFEIKIIDPGQHCYIAIGLTRRDYPKCRHPGWNKGSIAYHADDGKIFIGSGNGEAFGPRCHRGDIMGCGIIFPFDYIWEYDSDIGSHDFSPSPTDDAPQYFEYENFEEPLELDNYESDSESEDEEWWKQRNAVESDIPVKVFFTRNGITIGKRSVCIPKGGFYPTVGMLSKNEKVKVDLHPLSG